MLGTKKIIASLIVNTLQKHFPYPNKTKKSESWRNKKQRLVEGPTTMFIISVLQQRELQKINTSSIPERLPHLKITE